VRCSLSRISRSCPIDRDRLRREGMAVDVVLDGKMHSMSSDHPLRRRGVGQGSSRIPGDEVWSKERADRSDSRVLDADGGKHGKDRVDGLGLAPTTIYRSVRLLRSSWLASARLGVAPRLRRRRRLEVGD